MIIITLIAVIIYFNFDYYLHKQDSRYYKKEINKELSRGRVISSPSSKKRYYLW